MKVLRSILLGSLVMASVAATASPERVRLLGQTRVSKSTDTDRINVNSCNRLNEQVRAIRIHVLNGAVDIYRLAAHFGDGTSAIAHFNGRWFGGDTSGWIHFDRPRCLKQLVITANGANSRPVIEFWGKNVRR